MSRPSPYLEASLARWSERGEVARRDVELMLDGLEVKGHFLEGLRTRILQHRKEDLTQLKEAREEAWSQWDVRLQRVQEWIASADGLDHSFSWAVAWKNTSMWFDRARALLSRFSATLEKKAAPLEKRLFDLTGRLRLWSDRLLLKESEVRGYLQLEALKTTEPIITFSKKRYFLNTVYAERDMEAELARELKALRAAANLALERLARTESSVAQKANTNTGYFEIYKNQALEISNPLQRRFAQIRETALTQALAFEEGRTRLRWIYDTLQKLRVVEDLPSENRPLLDRLFKIDTP